MSRRPSRRLDLLSLTTFVALGLPDGMLGTAWPSMRSSLHVPVGDLGLVLLAYTAGAVTITTVMGRLVTRAGVARLLGASAALAVAASAAFAAAPVFAVVAGAGVAFGVAGGTMDGGLNIAVGLSGRGRLLNLLHGFYGLGTMIGPLIVTAAVVAGSWRPAYLVLLGFDAVLALLWLTGGPAWTPPAGEGRTAGAPTEVHGVPVVPGQGQVVVGPDPARSPRRRIAAGGIAVFFVYTGLEVGAGQWEATFARDHLHFSAAGAGLATFGYWAALTAVRMVLGVLPNPPGHRVVVRVGTGVAMAAAGVVWWNPAPGATVAAFVVLGAALAGVFPALVALTPSRVGPASAPRLIAWQIGAASAGGAATSAVIGLLVDASGLGVLGPAVTVLAVLLAAGESLLARLVSNTRSPEG